MAETVRAWRRGATRALACVTVGAGKALPCWVLALAAANGCAAAEYVVTSLADLPDVLAGDGACASANGACTLRAAIIEANASAAADVIRLGTGSHLLSLPGSNEDWALIGDLDVRSGLRLAGCGLGCTEIHGGGLDRLFDLHPGAMVQIESASLRAGRVQGSGDRGGAILVRSEATLHLVDVDLSDNSAAQGGALAVQGNLTAERVRLVANGTSQAPATTAGGAVWIGGAAARADFDQCEMRGNRAQRGGAVLANGSDLDIQLSRCLLTQNNARDGGALHGEFGNTQFELTNVTLSGNAASNAGGAIFADGQARFRIRSSSIAFNVADQRGGAIFDVRGSTPPQWVPITLSATVIAANQQVIGEQCALITSGTGPIVSTGATLRPPDPGCVMQVHPSDLAVADAGLLPLRAEGGFADVHPLHASSDALDRMLPAECTVRIDARGRRRPQGADNVGEARCDAGAFERDAPDLINESGFE